MFLVSFLFRLPVRECFLLGGYFNLCSDHFINISISMWVSYQPEVLLLSKWQDLPTLSFASRHPARKALGGSRVGSSHLYIFKKLFLGALSFICLFLFLRFSFIIFELFLC